MKKLIVCGAFLFAFGMLSAVATPAQVPELKLGGLNNRLIIVTDKNFEPQKSSPVISVKPGIAYEVWITTDGVLHCKTVSKLKSAAIKFTAPTISSANENGTTTGSGGDVSRKFELNKPEGGSAYLFDIAADKYKEKHAVTLFITSASGSKAEVILINKKVPAKIEK